MGYAWSLCFIFQARHYKLKRVARRRKILQPGAAALPPVCRSSIGLGGHLFPGLHRECHRTDPGTDCWVTGRTGGSGGNSYILEDGTPNFLSFLMQQPLT